MKYVIFIFLVSVASAATLEKRRSTFRPFDKIGNAHSLHPENRVIRGAEPLGHAKTLAKNGITDVIIFKKETKTEVSDEVAELRAAGFSSEKIMTIPFAWKDVKDFETPCKQSIRALQMIRDVLKSSDRKIYFHCTVGEDRTGLLAGLYRMVFENWDVEKSFGAEMCYHGYADGNRKKPKNVAETVDRNLTPVFVRMAYLVKLKKLTAEKIDESVCNEDPLASATDADLRKYSLSGLNCTN